MDIRLGAYPLLQPLKNAEEVLWVNPSYAVGTPDTDMSLADVEDAEERLRRFAPYLALAFPETKASNGIIESPLRRIPILQHALEVRYGIDIAGALWLKGDHALPISGSIKARGGIYEVLKYAESLAIQHGMLQKSDDYAQLATAPFREFFSRYAVAVGSTGNLGLSIGMMSAKLGFRVTVHMSNDAKAWKKKLLRSVGVLVKEYDGDFTEAVDAGRREAEQNPQCYFIDDEHSRDLFLGYAVAALRLKQQLDDAGVVVDAEHPLFLYLPCGVGGGPGGVTFGTKLVFGEHVHVFFAEPTHAPAMLLGMMTGLHDAISVHDIGLDNVTIADGLAVGRASSFVGKKMEHLLSGCYTVADEEMYALLALLNDHERIAVEPSATAGLFGLYHLFGTGAGRRYIEEQGLVQQMGNATHIVWATGGTMVPVAIMKADYERGQALISMNRIRSK